MSAVYRVEKSRDYTVMANHHLKNKDLSLKAKGLLSVILSLPDTWDFSVRGFTMMSPDGECSVTSALRELERAGYIVRSKRSRNEKGQITGIEYTVYELPQSKGNSSSACENPAPENPVPENPVPENPEPENPVSEKPVPENPVQLNTKRQKTHRENKKELNTHPSNIHPSINPSITRVDDLREKILDQIEYDTMVPELGKEWLDEIVDIMQDVYSTQSDTIRIGNETYPTALVQGRFRHLDALRLEYIKNCLDKTTSSIKNIRQYLLTALYNASSTMNQYYSAEVRHHLNSYEEAYDEI